MPKVEPNSLTHHSYFSFNRLSPLPGGVRSTHQETLAHKLKEACKGRENHSDSFSLLAEPDPVSGDTLLSWTDTFSGQSGRLGSLRPKERDAILRALFDQLRAWRKRCENYGYPKAMAAGGRR